MSWSVSLWYRRFGSLSFMIFSAPHTISPRSRAGFGLVELMVSIGIMVLIMSVVIVNQNSFSRGSLLRSQAYEIALRMRETQLLAVSTQVSEGDSRLRYGAYFSTTTATRFQVFAIPATTTVSLYSNYLVGAPGAIDSRFVLNGIVSVDSLGAQLPLPAIAVVFNRPNFDAVFYNPATGSEYTTATEVRLSVDSLRNPGSPRKIIITKAGQISVQ